MQASTRTIGRHLVDECAPPARALGWAAWSQPLRAAFYALLFLCAHRAAHAQYTIAWHTMDGGGGSGSAGSFAMSGTLGQPDVATGGVAPISFVGGYWSLLDEPVPLLRIFKNGSDIVLAWPNPSDGFGLQTSPELVPTSWTAVAIEPEKVGSEFQVTWGPPDGHRFFRLRRP